jgi:hypothetical protein
MIFDNPHAIVLDAVGNETGTIVPWVPDSIKAMSEAYRINGYALEINGDDNPLCDFRRLPGRVWTSRFGQEIRVFETDHDWWQCSFDGMDVSDGAGHRSEQEARQAAEAIDLYTPGPWAEGDYPKWADLLNPED